ncbi:MAG: acyl carrier protein [Clostridiales bacterium]
MNYKEKIISNISKISRISEKDLNLDTKIYDSRIISSLQMLEVMSEIEKQFNIMINPEELIPANFQDIKSIIGFIEKKIS